MNKKHGPEKGKKYIATNPFSFGQLLANARRKNGLTQDELAQKARVSKRTITYYERETQNPSLSIMSKIAKALEVPIENLLPKDAYDKAPVDRSLSRRIELANKLPPSARYELKKIIDGMLRAYGIINDESKSES